MRLRIQVVHGKPYGHTISFDNGQFIFGRGPECDVRPNSDLVSRQHCLLSVGDGGATIRDLGSRNGTLVNGQLVTEEQALADGDKLHLGPLVLLINFDDPERPFRDTTLIAGDGTDERPINVPA